MVCTLSVLHTFAYNSAIEEQLSHLEYSTDSKMPSATTDRAHTNGAINGHNGAPTSGLDLTVLGLNSGTSMVSKIDALREFFR